VRQHVNPLSRFFQLPKEVEPPEDLFGNASLPIHLDIGSARGRFLIDLASLHKDWNHIGVEIRSPLVLAAEKERIAMRLDNLCFLFCNANVSLPHWLYNLGPNQLGKVSIQFPDPWFKRRHYKRRVLQPELIIALSSAMSLGGQLFIQSDLLNVINPMIYLIKETSCFDSILEGESVFRERNPFPFMTEREAYASSQGIPIYRSLFRRNSQLPPDLNDFISNLKM
tara:strand:+ start:354 stop:1028 length:675 start_codon:yes stop_codon:yes gene_type:complete